MLRGQIYNASHRLGTGAVRSRPLTGGRGEPVAEERGPSTEAAPRRGPTPDPIVVAMRQGDERVFASLVDQESPAMLRLASLYAPSRAIAEEVVQETWLAVIGGLDSFEGRSSLRTWIYRILVNRAKSSGTSQRRTVSLLAEAEAAGPPAVDPARFEGPPLEHWCSPPNKWDELPEGRLLATETLAVIERAMERLPPGQQAVFELRDLRHWTAAEVCDVLELTDGNQRVLLHRARARMRTAIEEYFGTT